MDNREVFYIQRNHFDILTSLLNQSLDSFIDCRYLFNIKGYQFKHRLTGAETFINRFLNDINSRKYVVNVNDLEHLFIIFDNVLSSFTVGQHKLEVKLFNQIFYIQHQLKALTESIIKFNQIEN